MHREREHAFQDRELAINLCVGNSVDFSSALRDLPVPSRGMLADPKTSPGVRADFEQRNRMLRSVPVDIWSYGRDYGRFRKFEASLPAADPVEPFIDPGGYLKSIDQSEAKLREMLADQKTRKP